MFSAFRACSVMQNSPFPVPTRKPPATFTQSVCCARVLTGEQTGQFVKTKRGILCLCKKCATGLTHVQFVATENVSCPVSPQCLPVLYLHLFPFLRFRGYSPSCLWYGSLKGHTLLGKCQENPKGPFCPLQAQGRGSARERTSWNNILPDVFFPHIWSPE